VSPDTSHLASQLARQIENGGPISVAEFMRAANEAYYGRGDVFGVDGDFITAPEISQMFGELVGLWLADIWLRWGKPDRAYYVELGPGRGTLAADALRAVRPFGFQPSPFFVEQSAALRKIQSEKVPGVAFASSIDDLPEDGPLFIVANEFFDALPVQQLVCTHAGWRERVVVRERGAKFTAVPGSQPMDHIVPADFRNAPSPSVYETCPDAGNIMYELSGRLAAQGGTMLIVDYGYILPGLGDTLQAVKKHEFADPFDSPGDHDLTAHVNFMELANIARIRGLRVSGPVQQGAWLVSLGIDARTAALSRSAPDQAESLRAARHRLVDSSEMGNLFKVLAVSSNDSPPPEGFAPVKLIS
jgi:NADH dehydrogenase [ubiquinone] 1 alpha subcomplex assembly factor 7